MKFNKKTGTLLSLINCAVIMCFLTCMGVSAVLYERPIKSEVEKRELSKMPKFTIESYFSGAYNRQISQFVADTFPLREEFIKLAGKISLSQGFVFEDIRIHTTNNTDLDSTQPTESDIAEKVPQDPIDTNNGIETKPNSEASQSLSTKSENEDEAIRNGAIYVYKGKGFSVFGGTEATGKSYSQAINTYDNDLGDKVQIYNLVVPSPIEFGLPERYKSLSAPQKDRIENLNSNLNPNVKPINVYDTLKEHKDEYLYFSTDHHWTALGSYYAYCEFAKVAGFTPVEIKTLEKRTLTNFLGTLYAQTNDSTMTANPDYVDYYMMPTNCEVYQYVKNSPNMPRRVPLYGEYALPINSYSVFLHGDFPLTKIVTENKNGKKIAIVKESYGNAFVPWLVNNYEEIYVVDERYFQTSLEQLIEDNSIGELMFINNIFAAYSSFHINNILKIKNQIYVPYVPPKLTEEEIKASEAAAVSAAQKNEAEKKETSTLIFFADENDDD